MADLAATVITPIRAVIQYNDLTGQWEMHISRDRKDGTGNYYDPPDKQVSVSVTALLQILLSFWAILGPTGGSGVERNSPTEDPAAFAAWIGDQEILTVSRLEVPAGLGVLEAPDFTDYTPYTGGDDDWGVTPP